MELHFAEDIDLSRVDLNSERYKVEYKTSTQKTEFERSALPPVLVKEGKIFYPSINIESVLNQIKKKNRIKNALFFDAGEGKKSVFFGLYGLKKEMGGINPVEKSLFIKIFLDDIGNDIYKILGIPLNRNMISGYSKIYKLPDFAKELIVSGEVNEINAVKIITLFKDEYWGKLFKFIHGLKFGIKKRDEILEMIYDISVRDSLDIDEIINSDEIAKIQELKIDPPQKAERIFNIIFKKRYPERAAFIERVSQKLNKLGLPKNVRIETPKDFEKWEFDIRIRFKKSGELKEGIERINSLLSSGLIDDILENRY